MSNERPDKEKQSIGIDHFDRFFAVKYPPRECDGRVLDAMVGIYNGMLFWQKEMTYQFLEPVQDLEKAYEQKVFEITHYDFGDKPERPYEVLDVPLPVKRLYYSKSGNCYSEAEYTKCNP